MGARPSRISTQGWVCQCRGYCERDADAYARWVLDNKLEKPTSSTVNKSPRVTQCPTSPKSPKRLKSSPYLGWSILCNDNKDISGQMKVMTIV